MALILVLLFAFGCMAQVTEVSKLADSVTLGPLKFYLDEQFPHTAVCYKEQKEAYEDFIKQFHRQIQEISVKINRDLEQYPAVKQSVEKNLKLIAKTIKKYPQLMWKSMKEKKYEEASKILAKNVKKIKLYENGFEDSMTKLRDKSPKTADNIEAKYQEVKNEAIKNSETIYTNIFFCVSAL